MPTESGTAADRYDVLHYGDGTHRVVPAGDGRRVVAAIEREVARRGLLPAAATALIAAVVVGYGGFYLLDSLVISLAVAAIAGVIVGAARWRYWGDDDAVPDVVASDVPARVVREYVDEFDPDAVSDPFA